MTLIRGLYSVVSSPRWIIFTVGLALVIHFLMVVNDKRNFFSDSMLPYSFRGIVVHGFGRGGKKLNCPTANLDTKAVSELPEKFKEGVYGGLAQINGSPYYPMVMSVGHNVHFDNKVKTVEVHIMKNFTEDFYGSSLQGVAFQYIRPMKAFSSLQELIDAIEKDKTDTMTFLKENSQQIQSFLEKNGQQIEW